VDLGQLRFATDELLRGIDGLTDADVRAPSILPGWTRGHVLTHLARNAEGSTRLLIWARTGVPSYEYESHQARAAEIDRGAGRPAQVLVADVRDQAEAFFAAADGMPARCWQRIVTFTGGHDVEAARIVPLRLGEVHVHHVDLNIGYRPADWPAPFVRDYLTMALPGLKDFPVRIEASDTGRVHEVDGATMVVSGPEHAILAWLIGRSDGAGLARESDRADDGGLARESDIPLPEVPPLYSA
jgi:maleylpyruvate isomerase